MGIAKIVFYIDDEELIRWKYINKEGVLHAESARSFDTLAEAIQSAADVTGIMVLLDNHELRVTGVALYRPEAVGAEAGEVINKIKSLRAEAHADAEAERKALEGLSEHTE